jgi:hypothetical protein
MPMLISALLIKMNETGFRLGQKEFQLQQPNREKVLLPIDNEALKAERRHK